MPGLKPGIDIGSGSGASNLVPAAQSEWRLDQGGDSQAQVTESGLQHLVQEVRGYVLCPHIQASWCREFRLPHVSVNAADGEAVDSGRRARIDKSTVQSATFLRHSQIGIYGVNAPASKGIDWRSLSWVAAMGVGAALVMILSALVSRDAARLSSSNKAADFADPAALQRFPPQPPGSSRNDAASISGMTLPGSIPDRTATSAPYIGNGSPSQSLSGQMKRLDAQFAAEPVDREWSSAKRKQLVDSLSVIEGKISSAQIDCRSLTCRVELRSVESESPDQQSKRNALWADEVIKRTGFLRGDTEFFPDQFTSLSYFSMKPWGTLQLPPEIPPEVAESFRQSLRNGSTRPRLGPEAATGGPSGSRPATVAPISR